MSFDYDAPAELFLATSMKGSRRKKYRRFATAAEAIRYAVEDLPALRSLGAWLQVGDERFSTEKYSACMTMAPIRCVCLSDRAPTRTRSQQRRRRA